MANVPISLPISAATFRRAFKGGNGNLEIISDNWQPLFLSNAPFIPGSDRVAEISFSGATPSLTLGSDTVKVGVSIGGSILHQIQLVWPTDVIDPNNTFGALPTPTTLLARLALRGNVDGAANAGFPIGPLSATIGVAAGGHLSFERLKLYPLVSSAQSILLDLLSEARLPQQVDAVTEIPEADEILVSRFGGYLKLSGAVSYGYAMSGSRDLAVGGLKLDLDYALRILAGLSATYQIQGDYQIEARRGTKDNFVRFVARKSRESAFSFNGDFGFHLKLDVNGLPDTAEEFLEKALGTKGERILKVFAQAKRFTSVDELEKELGKIARAAAEDLSNLLIGEVLSNENVSRFIDEALKVARTYNELDSRVVQIYEDFIDRIGSLTDLVDELTGVAGGEDLRNITDPDVWQLIRKLAGPGLFDVLLDRTAFGELRTRIEQLDALIRDGGKQQLRETIAKLKAAFPLHSLFEQLGNIRDDNELARLGSLKLQGIVERLVGKAFETIRGSEAGRVLKEIHAALNKVDEFKAAYYKKLQEVAHSNLRASATFAYNSSTAATALIDIEIDVSDPAGQKLARACGRGDFAEAINQFASPIVRLNHGAFTQETIGSTQLQVNLFGLEIGGLTRLIQRSNEALETHEGGLLHVYTTETMLEQRKQHGAELTVSTFVLSMAAKAIQTPGEKEVIVRTLPRMSSNYSLTKEDDKTSPEEMNGILDFAEITGLVPSARDFAQQLRSEFPKGLGKVKAEYVVRYEPDDVAFAFALDNSADRATMRRVARETIRRFVAAKYTGMKKTAHLAPLGFAYLSSMLFEQFRTLGFAQFSKLHIAVTLPSWFTGGNPQKVSLSDQLKNNLVTLYNIENKYVSRLLKLDVLIDGITSSGAGGTIEELNKLSKDFVGMADDMEFGRENTFFAVFDALILAGSAGRAKRHSALVLEITAPDAPAVTKLITPTAVSAGDTFIVTGSGEGIEAAAAGN